MTEKMQDLLDKAFSVNSPEKIPGATENVTEILLEDIIQNYKSGNVSRPNIIYDDTRCLLDALLNEFVANPKKTPEWECTTRERILECWENDDCDEISKVMLFFAKL